MVDVMNLFVPLHEGKIGCEDKCDGSEVGLWYQGEIYSIEFLIKLIDTMETIH